MRWLPSVFDKEVREENQGAWETPQRGFHARYYLLCVLYASILIALLEHIDGRVISAKDPVLFVGA
jgi:hypothetical protein